jgi:hypothetical protein
VPLSSLYILRCLWTYTKTTSQICFYCHRNKLSFIFYDLGFPLDSFPKFKSGNCTECFFSLVLLVDFDTAEVVNTRRFTGLKVFLCVSVPWFNAIINGCMKKLLETERRGEERGENGERESGERLSECEKELRGV